MRTLDGHPDYMLVGENQKMWLAVKPFIVRTPISWSCVVGLRYRGGHDSGVHVDDPTVNGMAWIAIEWQKATNDHATANYPLTGLNISGPVDAAQITDAIDPNLFEQMALHVCARVDPRTRVHDFNPGTLKSFLVDGLTDQTAKLPPGQDIPDEIKHLPEEEIMQRVANVLEGFMKMGCPDDFPYNKQVQEQKGPLH